MKQRKIDVYKVLITITIFLIVFLCVHIPAVWLLLIILLVNACILSRFYKKENRVLLENLLEVEICLCTSYVLSVFARAGLSISALLHRGISFVYIHWLWLLLLVIEWTLLLYICKDNAIEETKQLPKVFPERMYDLEQLKRHVDSGQIIGLNSQWGSGKSFAIKTFIKEHSEEYDFIEIDLLTVNIDNARSVLVKRIESILHYNGIYSGFIHELDFAANSSNYLFRLGNILFSAVHSVVNSDEKETATVLDRLREKAELLHKPVVIIYEDLDRIDNCSGIKMLLDFSERLTGNKIRFIIQYDSGRLAELGFNRAYLEKYVPFEMKLTDLRLRDQIRMLGTEIGLSNAQLEKLIGYLSRPGIAYDLRKMLGVSIQPLLKTEVRGIPTRIVRSFLLEYKLELEWCESDETTHNTMIAVVYMKHFEYIEYEKLKIDVPLPECLLLTDGEDSYTLYDLYTMRLNKEIADEEVRTIVDQNIVVLYLLTRFDYSWKSWMMSKEEETWRERNKGDVQGLKHRLNNHDKSFAKNDRDLCDNERNFKIDHIVWYFIGRGTSEYTDVQTSINKWKEMSREVEPDKLKEAWQKYQKEYYRGENIYKDNQTIFKIGTAPETSLFHAFLVTNQTQQSWMELLRMYFDSFAPNCIDQKLIDTMNYVDLTKGKDLLVYCADHFVKLDIIGNMNALKTYWRFLAKFINAISYWGYADSEFYNMRQGEYLEESNSERCNLYIMSIEKDIAIKQDRYCGGVLFAQECRILRKFLDHNVQLIGCSTCVSDDISRRPKIYVRKKNSDVYTELLEKTKYENVMGEIDLAYRHGEITPREFMELT